MFTVQILLQLIIILLLGQFAGTLCKRMGQQWVIGEILVGLALGPSLFGYLWPGLFAKVFPTSVLPTFQTLGDIGLILYMFSLGSKLDIHSMLRQSRKAIIVSASGILLPFAMGAALGYFLYPSLAGVKATLVPFMLIVGVAMAITAFPVLARLLVERRLLGTPIGMLALTSASIDDVVAWCLLALVAGMIRAQGFLAIIVTVGCTILFVVVMLLGIRPLLAYAAHRFQSQRFLLVLSVLILLCAAYTTATIGIHPIFGAFLAGVVLPRNMTFTEQIRSMDQINSLLFLPLFFVFSGLQTQVGLIQGLDQWLICGLIFLVACSGKIFGGTLSAKATGEAWRAALSVGILMNTRGLIELIVINIGLELGVLSPMLFSMLVIMAIVTTMMASPLLTLVRYRPTNASVEQDATLVEPSVS